jgi:hypothetical protein
MRVQPNGSGTIRVVVIADAEIVKAAPGLKGDIRVDDLVAAGWTVDGPRSSDDGALVLVLQHSFNGPAEATALLSQINGTRGPLHDMAVTRTGKDTNSTWKLTGRLEINGGLEAFADDATNTLLGGGPFSEQIAARGTDLGDAIGITFIAGLPGTVDSTTGKTGAGVITWRVPTDGTPTDIATTVTNVDVASSISRVGRVLVLGLLVLWVLGSLFLIFMVMNARNKRPRTPRI